MNLAQIETAVCAKGFATNTGGLLEAINAAYREVLAARRWPFLDRVNVSSLPTVVGQGYVLLASTINDLVTLETVLHIDSARIDDGDDSIDLEWMPLQQIQRALNLDRSTGRPEAWCRQDDRVLLYPRPNSVEELRIEYVAMVDDLENTSDPLIIPRIYCDAVVWGAVANLAFRQRDYAAADRAEKKRDDAVLRMVRAYGIEQRQGRRRVAETGFWDSM